MCDSGGGDEKKRYFLGPWEDPGDPPRALMGLEAAVDTLRSYFEDMDEGDEIRFKLVLLTDKEVEALPEM